MLVRRSVHDPSERTAVIRLRSIRIALNFLFAFFIAVAPALTAALDSRQIGDDGYRHSLWTVKDGLYGTVQAVAQAPDGFLLIGTSEGLFCFDGLLFRPVRQQTGEPILGSISTLLPLPSGDLWIGYTLGGASLLRDGKLTRFTERDGFPLAQVRAFAETPGGSVWAATVGGLARFSGSRWNRIRSQSGSGYLGRSPWTVFTDRGGRLWVPSSHSTFYLDPGSSHFSGLGTSSERRDLSLTEGASRLLWTIEDVHHRLELLPGATIFGERTGWVPHNSTGYMLRDSLGQVWSKTDAKAVWRGCRAKRPEPPSVLVVGIERLGVPVRNNRTFDRSRRHWGYLTGYAPPSVMTFAPTHSHFPSRRCHS
jgi:ligand-binding sensor domain-containing protein